MENGDIERIHLPKNCTAEEFLRAWNLERAKLGLPPVMPAPPPQNTGTRRLTILFRPAPQNKSQKQSGE